MIIGFLQWIIKPVFGDFEREELKKFFRMGAVFAAIIGSYWALRVLKNSVFCTLVGAGDLANAKIGSVVFLIPILMIYTKLLDKMSRSSVFYLLSAVYGSIFAFLGFLLTQEGFGEASCEVMASRTGLMYFATMLLAYTFYFAVESYGSLLPALFWAIASETTMPESAKKGFSLVVALGQIGGVFGPLFIASVPQYFNFQTNGVALVIAGFTAGGIAVFALHSFFANTPASLMVSFAGSNTQKVEHEQEPGFMEGLYLLFRHKYLLGIFLVVAFPEFITAVIDLHFNSLAAQTYTGTALSGYLSLYGSAVNVVALLFLFLGISNITRVLGVSIALLLMPIIYGFSLAGFISFNSLTFLFGLMACSKAINYALNVPAIKQLYIPTSHDSRFKAQAWIESFGSRGSKGTSAVFNKLLKPWQKTLGEVAGRAKHALVFSYLGFTIIGLWLLVAYFIGKKYNDAVANKKLVC